MDLNLKKKIHASMRELLVSKGWPDRLTNDQVLHMLPSLWKKLEAEGLLKDVVSSGFGYKRFVDTAIQAKNKALAMDRMNEFLRRR